MNVNEIKSKSVKGVTWTVLLSIIAIPLGFLINVILGRVSSEALGIYALINVFITFVATFILFGGTNVIVRYIPDVPLEKKKSFLLSYLFIVFLIMAIIITIIYFNPQVLEYLLGNDVPSYLLPYLMLFIPIVLSYHVFNYALNGLMEIKTSVLLRQIITYGNCIVFGVLLIFFYNFFVENSWLIIFGLFFFNYSILTILTTYLTIKKFNSINPSSTNLKKKLFNYKDIRLYLPDGFWKFATFVHLSTIATFFYDKIDQIVIMLNFNVGELGFYYAALQLSSLIRILPNLVGSVLLPTFSNIISKNDENSIKNIYRLTIRYNTLLIVPASLFCVFFAKPLLGIFGNEYQEYYLITITLAIFFMASSIGSVSPSLVIAKGESTTYLVNSIIQVVFQILLIYLLFNKIGILSLAISRGASVLLAHLGLIIILYKLYGDFRMIVTDEYIISILITILVATSYYVLQPLDLFSNMALFALFLILFLYLGKFSLKDITYIFRLIKESNKN